MFRGAKGPNGEIVIHQEMLPMPPPTPEKFQRKARLRRLRQRLRDVGDVGVALRRQFLEAEQRVEDDYEAK